PPHPSLPHRDLPSFPPRRSSDLASNLGQRPHDRFVQAVGAGIAFERPAQTPLFEELGVLEEPAVVDREDVIGVPEHVGVVTLDEDRKSTRLNSSHLGISYAVFCL